VGWMTWEGHREARLAAGAAREAGHQGVSGVARFEPNLRQGCRNGSMGVIDRDPEGESGPRA
jgi:hypothetical protein